MTQLFRNNASTTITSALLVGTSTIDVTDATAFGPTPTGSDYILVTLHDAQYENWEVVKVATIAGNSFTSINRAFESTAKAWPIGTLVTTNITKATLEQLQTDTGTAQTAADDAQTDATQALDDLAALEQGGGPSTSVTITSIDLDQDADVDTHVFKVGYICVGDGESNITNRDGTMQAVTEWTGASWTAGPIPYISLGLNPHDAHKIRVFRNGVQIPQGQSAKGALDTYSADSWTWHGHMWIHLDPILSNDDVITVVGFDADSYEPPNQQVTEYSWLCGGQPSTVDTSVVNRLSWVNHTRTSVTGMSYAGSDGGGGTTDGTYGRVFGGISDLTSWARMLISSGAWTSYVGQLNVGLSRTGCATSGTSSYIFGISSLTGIEKILHSTEADSILTATCAGGYYWGDASSNVAQTYALYVPGSVSTNYNKYKLTYATEATEQRNADTYNFTNWRYYNMHTWYDDKGTRGALATWFNFSTEVWFAGTAGWWGDNSFSRNYAQEAVCDGGTYVIGYDVKMVYPTAVMIHFVAYDSTDADNTRAGEQVGCFSDSWGASK